MKVRVRDLISYRAGHLQKWLPPISKKVSFDVKQITVLLKVLAFSYNNAHCVYRILKKLN